MFIAVMSDTHNRIGTLQAVLDYLISRQIDTIFHCGDVTSLETARLLGGLNVHYVFGNGDSESQTITDFLTSMNPNSTGGPKFSGQIAGKTIGATHSHIPGVLNSLIADGTYDYVFHGHTHVQRNQIIGRTRVINPGALGSSRYDGRTLCILDLLTDQVDFPDFEG